MAVKLNFLQLGITFDNAEQVVINLDIVGSFFADGAFPFLSCILTVVIGQDETFEVKRLVM